jgi:hypothetical protein
MLAQILAPDTVMRIGSYEVITPVLGHLDDGEKIRPKMVDLCRPLFEETIKYLNPRVVCVVGADVAKMVAAQRAHLPTTVYGRTFRIEDQVFFALPDIRAIGGGEDGQFWVTTFLSIFEAFDRYLSKQLGKRKQ